MRRHVKTAELHSPSPTAPATTEAGGTTSGSSATRLVSPLSSVWRRTWQLRCGQWDSVSNVAIYRLDENCYPNAAGTESHQLTLGHSVTISDATCSNVATTTTVRESVLGASQIGFCVDDMTGFVMGALPDLNFVANYDDDTCSNTPNRLTFTQDFVCKQTTDSPCQSDGTSHFSVSGCADDFSAKAAEVFGANSPYVIVADYPNQWCYNVVYVTVYAADGLCHTNADDATSFKVSISTEGTATVLLYSDTACMTVVSSTNLDTNILSSSLCVFRTCEYWFGCGTRYSVVVWELLCRWTRRLQLSRMRTASDWKIILAIRRKYIAALYKYKL